MSWAAHEFENYFIQKHIGTRASFLAVALGTLAPDLFTKAFVYAADDPAQFHRGWPGVGFTHSLIFGVVFAAVILWATRSRSWALGVLIGQWAHVLTDIADTAGVMPFFPFSTEPFTVSMWKHAAVLGRHGDAMAYYSSLGGVWDLFWFAVLVVFARNTLRRDYFRNVIVRADPRAWGWLARHLSLGEEGLLLLYRGLVFYGTGRMVSWFLYARLVGDTRLDLSWGGPAGITGNDLSGASWVEMAVRTALGGVAFGVFLWVLWRALGRRMWDRAAIPT